MTSHSPTIRTRILAFLTLSRFQQAVTSLTEPACVALVALKALPDDPNRISFAIAVTLAGYLALFAANDLLDINIDRPRFSGQRKYNEYEIDWATVRHPLALDYVSFLHGAIWMIFLAIFTIVGAYLLNPIAAVFFLAAGLLEILYCKLAKITPLKFLLFGIVTALMALAGWFAVVPTIDIPVLVAIFVWLYGWGVGGRNMIKDWLDLDEDIKSGIKTVPAVYGRRVAMWVIMFHLALSFVGSLLMGSLVHLNPVYFVLAFVAANYLMLGPGVRLLFQPKPEAALYVLNRASLYPPIMLFVILASLLLPL